MTLCNGRKPRRGLRIVGAVAALAVGALVAAPAAGASEGVVFTYQNPNDPRFAQKLGRPYLTVATYDSAVTPIHAAGSLAFRYTQATWFPATGTWMGTTAAQRQAWRLCPDAGTVKNGETWYYADANERGFVDAMLAEAARVKALGFDGLFFDVAGKSLGGPTAGVTSTCTADPANAPASSALQYLSLVKRIRDTHGLQVALNNPPPNMTPSWLAFSLRENAANPLVTSAAQTVSHARSTFGTVEVQMAKSLKPATHPLKSAEEVYLWSLARLSGQPVVVNTGYDECSTGPVDHEGCNRMGSTPDLASLRLGAPVGALEQQGTVYLRRFQRGFVVVNTGTQPARYDLHLSRCRTLHRVRAGLLNGGACTQDIRLWVGAARGWVVTYN